MDNNNYQNNDMEQSNGEQNNFNGQEYNNQDPIYYNNYSYEMNNINSMEPIKPAPKKKRKFFKAVQFTFAAVLFGVIAGVTFQGYTYLSSKSEENKKVDLDTDKSIDNDRDDEGNDSAEVQSVSNKIIAHDVSDIVENVIPSIVAINSKATKTEYDFFGRTYSEEVQGSGSGIIIGQNGTELLIVTNNHVVEGAEEVEIVFLDDEKAIAKVKGAESRSDLAVLSVALDDLKKDTKDKIKIATLGNSDDLKLGELAIAIGNALGYGQSVTVGYISAIDREVKVDDIKLNLVQTDAAINPGNSGGALLNAKGELIGINSVKYASAKVEGMGFAIPISEAIPVINELMDRETLEERDRAFLGINTATARDVTEADSKRFSMPIGIYVNEVVKDSPAEKAGLKQGDIIVGINNKTIETIEDLVNVLSYTRAGEKVDLMINVLEDGKYVERTLKITLGNRPTTIDEIPE